MLLSNWLLLISTCYLSVRILDVTASWSKSDSGMVFRWLFSPSHKTKNEIESYQMIVDFESDLKSTNGVLAGKQVRWFVYTDKMNPNGAFFVARKNTSNKN
ncbi:MAG: hypothetical protein IPG99_07380 [Ignavibacteria bacterium]|nr:hypothetical protein [Ignavibacteria bacterium]